MPLKYDAIIVGLGPAGAAAAYKLASNGLMVLALDKEKFPRYKTCGGAVSYKVNKILNMDFSSAAEDVTEGIVFSFRAKRQIFIPHNTPIATMVMRDRFDNLLAEKAKAKGVEILYNIKVNGIEEDDSQVVVKTEKEDFKASAVVAADGASSFIARDYFKIPLKPNTLTIEGEFSLDKEILSTLKGKAIIDFGLIPWGYGWIFPKGNNLSVGIAGLSSKTNSNFKNYYNEFVKRHDILKGLKPIREGGWIIPQFLGNKIKISGKRILLAGDAAHIVDPFIGEGIYYAIRSGQIAANAITCGIKNNDFTSYEKEIEREIYPELEAAQKVADMVYSYPKIWSSMLEADTAFIKKYYDVITGDCSYQAFLQEILTTSKFSILIKAVKGWLKEVIRWEGS
ncbi:MAG: geranylgeranyl reductase family protein [Deltaproteobacteria bacterium]|nr:geranylgeranyl reductase family protein [Deltaproteobacteria bacterium]